MAESLLIDKRAPKSERYDMLWPQWSALIDGETDAVAVMANTAAVLKESFDWLWVGFYVVYEDELILGPFQGPVACMRIRFGRGVCGSAWKQSQSLIVPDVEAFADHISCCSLSRSEIVVPIFNSQSKVAAVLDADSKELNGFDQTDRQHLERICAQIGERF